MFEDIFEQARKKLTNYFGLGRPGLGTFGQQVNRVKQSPFIQRGTVAYRNQPSIRKVVKPVVKPVVEPVVKSVVKPAVNFFRQNPTPYSFINRNIVKPAISQAKTNFQNSPIMEDVNRLRSGGFRYNPPKPPTGSSGSKVDQFVRSNVVKPIRGSFNNYQNRIRNISQTPTGQMLGIKPLNERLADYQSVLFNPNDPKGQEILTNMAIDFSAGTQRVGKIGQIATQIAKTKSKPLIKNLLRQAGLEKAPKELIKNLADEVNPQKIRGMIGLAKKMQKIDQKLPISQRGDKAGIPSTKPLVYDAKVANGEIRPPSITESLIKTAQGNPDLEATKAARRILDKKGIDYASLPPTPKTAKIPLKNEATDALRGEAKATPPLSNEAKDNTILYQDIRNFAQRNQGKTPQQIKENLLKEFGKDPEITLYRGVSPSLRPSPLESDISSTVGKFWSPNPAHSELFAQRGEGGKIHSITVKASDLLDRSKARIPEKEIQLLDNSLQQNSKVIKYFSPQSTQGANKAVNLGRKLPQQEKQIATSTKTKPPLVLEQSTVKSPNLAENPKTVSLAQSIEPKSVNVNDPVQKITSILKEAKPLSMEQKALTSKLRGQQFAKMMSARGRTTGEKGFFAELGALKGGAKKVDFQSIRPKLEQADIDTLFDRVNEANIGEWEKINAKASLAKLLSGEGVTIPTQNELKLLNDVFGSEFTKAILDKRSTWQKFMSGAGEALNLPRSLMASFDLSAPLRQGIFLVGRPKQWVPAFISMFKQFGSEKAYRAVQESIQAKPTYKIMRQARLAITDVGNLATGREEQFMSNLAEKIPVIGKGVRASGRAYTGFLNKLRADVFDDLYKKAKILGQDSPDMADDIAKFVNSATGRGDLGKLNNAATALNGVFFSPRLMASRVNLLNPVYYAQLNPMVRKEALKSLLTFGAVAGTALGLAKAGGADVGTDPRSADFGKIKVGDTRYDILGGFQQYIVLASRLLSGKMVSSTTGKEISLTEGYKPTTRKDIIINFLQSKENPILSYLTNWAEGTTQLGQKFRPIPELIDRMIPMLAQDLVELADDKGWVKATGMTLPAIFGTGVQTYGKQIPSMSERGKLEWRNPPSIGERIYNKATGQQVSNIPEDQQKTLSAQHRIELKNKAVMDTAKAEILKNKEGSAQVGDKTIWWDEENEEIKTGSKEDYDKYLFDKSGKKSQIIGDTYYYRDKNGNPKSMTMSEYRTKVRKSKMDVAYNNKDYKEWTKLALEELADIESRFNEADELTKLELLDDYQDLIAKIAKYQSYGGFTKGSGGGSSKKKIPAFSIPESVTAPKKIPIRQAKRPTFSTGKISVKAPQVRKLPVKGITKEYLSKLR